MAVANIKALVLSGLNSVINRESNISIALRRKVSLLHQVKISENKLLQEAVLCPLDSEQKQAFVIVFFPA